MMGDVTEILSAPGCTCITPAPTRREWTAMGIAAILLIVGGMIVYWPDLRGPYSGDELRLMFPDWPMDWRYFFTHHGDDFHSYRPLEYFISAVIQRRFGWDTWPIHSIAFLLHTSLCGLIFVTARRLKLSLTQAGVATAFAMLWQFAAGAVLLNGLSQVASTFFGSASVLTLWSARRSATGATRVALLAASVLSFAIAMFFKETSAGFLAVIILCLVLWERLPGPMRLSRAGAYLSPYLAVEAVYFALRSHAGATAPREVYSLSTNLFRNVGLSMFATVDPLSSVATAIAAHRRDLPVLLATGVLCAVTGTLVVAGVRKCGRARLGGFVLLLTLVMLGPVIPLRQVSELYLYTAMPFVAVLFGMGMGALFDDGRWRLPAGAFIVLSLVLNAQAVHSKAKMEDANGQSAAAMIDVIQRALPKVPLNGRILLAYSSPGPDYSRFLVHGFDVLAVGAYRVGPLLGRADVGVELITPEQAQALVPDSRTFVFTFQNGEMHGPEHTGNKEDGH